MLTAHPLNEHFQVQFAHPGDQGLAERFVHFDHEGRIFFSQLAQRLAHLVLIDLCLRLDRDFDDRRREANLLQDDRMGFIAQCIAGEGFLQQHE